MFQGNKMCCVKGCCKPESYCRTLFQVPMAKSLSADSFDDPLAVKRRSAWLKAIDIQTFVDMDRANSLPLLFVCSDHFQSSNKLDSFTITNFFRRNCVKFIFIEKPAEFYQQDHVDWVPSLLMGKKLNNAPKGNLLLRHRLKLFVLYIYCVHYQVLLKRWKSIH